MSLWRKKKMKPLEGVTILDLTRVVAGPYATMILADLGARVIKIENPGDPDYTRDFEPYLVDGDKRQSAFFAQYNRNKEAITLNLKEPRAKDIFRQMVQKADIVVENYRAGVMDKLGVGYENLKTYNPKLVYTAISGFGQTGPYSTWPAYDNSGQALSGLWSMNGIPGEPTRIGTIIGDLAATFFGAIGTLSAYIHAQKTGQGQLVDVAQLDASLALTENAVSNYTVGDQVQQPLGNDHPLCRPYGKFRAKDGEVFFGGYTDRFWKTTCEFFGEPGLLQDPEIDTMAKRFDEEVYNRRILPKINQWFSAYTCQELQDALAEKLPLTAIHTIDQVLLDPQLNHRDMFIDYAYGNAHGKLFGTPIKLSETPCDTSGRAPEIGEGNARIYQEFLGYSEEEIRVLSEEGVL
jgi:CoA:oxalate CoA-transferase